MNTEIDSDLFATPSACALSEKKSFRQIDLQMDQTLVLPFAKRMQVRCSESQSGEMEMHLDYGEREISFDDPALFGFAEGLATHPRFLARDATRWGNGYDWFSIK